MTKEFHLGTVLSITTGKLFSPDGVGGIYDICGYMTGEPGLMTHQLPRVMDEIAPHIFKQHPGLFGIHPPEGLDTWEKIFGWMDSELYDIYGEMLSLEPIPEQDHTYIDPISELSMKMPGKQIIVVEMDDD